MIRFRPKTRAEMADNAKPPRRGNAEAVPVTKPKGEAKPKAPKGKKARAAD